MTKGLVRWLIFLCGWLALILGFIGIFLPVLPTTPFIILAASCFAKTSKRFHHWLIHHRIVGPPLRQWQTERTVRRPIKVRALVLIVVTFSLSIYFTPMVWVKLFLVGVFCICFYCVARLPEKRLQS